MTPAEQQAANGRLETRIKELRELEASGLKAGDDPPVQELEQRNRSTLASIYGENSTEYARLRCRASRRDLIHDEFRLRRRWRHKHRRNSRGSESRSAQGNRHSARKSTR